MEVPHGDVSIGAAGEADLGIGADGQSIAGRSRGSELSLDAGRLRGQIPDGQRARLAADDQGAAVGQQLAGADVIVSVLEKIKERKWCEFQMRKKKKKIIEKPTYCSTSTFNTFSFTS